MGSILIIVAIAVVGYMAWKKIGPFKPGGWIDQHLKGAGSTAVPGPSDFYQEVGNTPSAEEICRQICVDDPSSDGCKACLNLAAKGG